MRKGLVGIFLLIQIIGLSNLGYCKWSLINKTPPIEGRVTDATTGEPIENVVISCEWVQEVPAFVDTVSKGFAHEVVITDKEGRYRIPSKTSVHFPPLLFVGSQFDEISIIISHPLYSRPMWIGAKKDYLIIGSEKRRIYKSEDGIIHWDIELLSLEGKYIRAIEHWKSEKVIVDREDEIEKLLGNLWSEIWNYYTAGEARGYFVTMKEFGITNITLDKVVKDWREIVSKVQDYKEFYNKLLHDIGEVEKSNRESLEKAGY